MKVRFTNVHVWDGDGAERFAAEVLVSGDRIEAVAYGRADLPREDVTVVDAGGATLMPGLIDAHAHLPFPPTHYLTQMDDLPPEDILMAGVHNARLLLDHGYTGCIGAGSPRLRSEITLRNEINAGRLPGPRLLASSPTIVATGGLNDNGRLHQTVNPCAMVADGVDPIRQAVRLAAREGVDLIKANLSGDSLVAPPGKVTTYAENEVQAIVETAHRLRLKVAVHARSADAVKYALRQGADIIHHADYCDDEALDLFEAAKGRVFAGPSIGFLHFLRFEAGAFFPPAALTAMEVEDHMACNIATHNVLRRRGIKAVIGGDYGIPWQPHSRSAFDLEAFVKYLGYSAVDALRCGTWHGAQAMGRGHELGRVQPGYLADLLLVRGDPTQDVTLLQDPKNLLAIMKNGLFHKAPAPSACAHTTSTACG